MHPGSSQIQPKPRFGLQFQREHWVVSQVLTDTGEVADHGYSMAGEMLRWTKSREHEKLWSSDPSRGQHDLIALYREPLSPAFHFDPHSPGTFEQYPRCQRASPDCQIQPVARRVQIGKGGAHPDAVPGIKGHRAYSGGVRVVHVRVVGEPGPQAGLIEGFLKRTPLLTVEPPDRNRPVSPMKVVPDVGVVLQPAEIGQEFEERPIFVALGRPSVVILWNSPEEHLTVDGAGATDDPAPVGVHRRGLLGCANGPVPPVVRRSLGGCCLAISVGYLRRQVLGGQVVGTGLQQQDRS